MAIYVGFSETEHILIGNKCLLYIHIKLFFSTGLLLLSNQ
jgi:hypothetical protein